MRRERTEQKRKALEPSLQKLLEEVGPERYGLASARQVYLLNRRERRPRYAKM